MRIGGNWHVHHLTDRVVELRNPDYLYHRFTGRDGFVLVRVDPTMSREQAMQRAIDLAQRNDAELALRASKALVPDKHALAAYTGQQVRFKPAFATPEDADVIGVKRA